MTEPLVFMEGINKSFPGVQALADCRIELVGGEVHALMGENGAGKTTLMKVLTGVYKKDAGRVLYMGREVDVRDPKHAQELGIGMIHQELNLASDLTVSQNIYLGRETRVLGLFMDHKRMHNKVQALFQRLGLDLDPNAYVHELTVAKQQMVEIAKALSFNSNVLIMDEPTASLSDAETDELFRMIEQLRNDGVGIIYISHRMEEIKRISDRVTVMRDGTYIGTEKTSAVTDDQIISMMVGRKLELERRTSVFCEESPVVLEVKDLHGGRKLQNIHLRLRKGEIVGLAGLMGAGRTELARAIFGADPIDSGKVFVHGKEVKINQPSDAVKHGIGYLSEDRKQFGCMVDMDVKTNVVVASYTRFSSWGWMNDAEISDTAEEYIRKLRVKTPSVDQQVKYLSGGNQQKVVIGKWLARDCEILMFDEPTRGIDVGAKAEIYKLLHSLAVQGKSILMISSEMSEILRMSDRIVVMCEGRITGELSREEATQEKIMKLATERSVMLDQQERRGSA